MGKIAHLKVACPQCGKYSNISLFIASTMLVIALCGCSENYKRHVTAFFKGNCPFKVFYRFVVFAVLAFCLLRGGIENF